MSPSFRKIDYSLRPAKHTERRMLLDVFRCAAGFESLDNYRYLGMGSVWFADFILVHRMLGITDMISIEWPRGAEARVEANKPFKCVTCLHKSTSSALPDLDWSKRQLIWLDYDSTLNPDMLLDARIIAQRVRSGSILAVSVQCQEASEMQKARDAKDGRAKERFVDTFGRDRVPDFDEDDLIGWRYGALCRRLLLQEIESALSNRNLGVEDHEQVEAISICSIEYADDAKMTTAVLLFVSKEEIFNLFRCGFERIDFLRTFGETIRIEMPKLTLAEMASLKPQLPIEDAGELILGEMPSADANKFARLYRYLPNFAVLES